MTCGSSKRLRRRATIVELTVQEPPHADLAESAEAWRKFTLPMSFRRRITTEGDSREMDDMIPRGRQHDPAQMTMSKTTLYDI